MFTLARWVRYGAFSMVFLPLVYHPHFFFPYTSLKAYLFIALTELTFVGYLWLIAFAPHYRPRFSRIGVLLGLFLLVLLLASLLGVHPSLSFWGHAARDLNGLVWIHLGLIFVVFTGMFRTMQDWKQLFQLSVLVALLMTFFHLLSLFGLDVFTRMRQGSMFGNSTFFGTYLLFQIFFSSILFLQASGRRRFVWVGAGVLFVIALLTSTAQAAWFSFLAAVVLFFLIILLFTQTKPVYRWIGRVGLSVFLLSGMTSLVMGVWPGTKIYALFTTLTSPARPTLWQIALQAIAERPWLGWGLESFPFVFFRYYDACFGSSACGQEVWYDRAHNQWLDLFVQTGVIGVTVFLALLCVLAWTLWRATHHSRLSRSAFALTVAFLFAYFSQNLTGFDTGISLLFFFLMIAWIQSLVVFDVPSVVRAQTGYFFLTSIMTIALPFTLYAFSIQPARANYQTVVASQARQMSVRLQAYEDAVFQSAWGMDERRSFLAGQTAAMIWDLPDAQRQQGPRFFEQELTLAETGLKETLEHSAFDLRASLNLGLIYLTRARYFDPVYYEPATVVLSSALKNHPNNPLPYWGLVMVLLDQQQWEQAEQVADQALALNPSVDDSQLRRFIVRLFLEDEPALESASDDILAIMPELRIRLQALRKLRPQTDQDVLLSKFYYDIKP